MKRYSVTGQILSLHQVHNKKQDILTFDNNPFLEELKLIGYVKKNRLIKTKVLTKELFRFIHKAYITTQIIKGKVVVVCAAKINENSKPLTIICEYGN